MNFFNKTIFVNFSSLNISSTVSKSAAVTACETYSEKNHRLKRPLSPHLSIYKPQLTSMLSISHRASGIVLAYYATGAGLSKLPRNSYIYFF